LQPTNDRSADAERWNDPDDSINQRAGSPRLLEITTINNSKADFLSSKTRDQQAIAEPINGIPENPRELDDTGEDYLFSVSLCPCRSPSSARDSEPCVCRSTERLILSMIGRDEGMMVRLGYPTPAS